MQAGDLDQLITLKRIVRTGDGSGGAVKTPQAYATNVWASVKPQRGNEREKADRIEAISGYLITIRYRSDVIEGDIVVWGTRTLNIRFIRDAGVRKPFLEFEADKGAAG